MYLLFTDYEEEGEYIWKIFFDFSLKEVIIFLSGLGF